MSGISISDKQWNKILDFIKDCPGIYVCSEEKCKRFIEAVLWMTRSGAQWRLLPEKYGSWNSVFKRFDRWSNKKIWEKMHNFFANDPDMESIIIDATIVRAHSCAAGAKKK